MSMSTGGSSVVPLGVSVNTFFTVSNEGDMLALLRKVHLSNLSPEDKNHLRDVIFNNITQGLDTFSDEQIAEFVSFGFGPADASSDTKETDSSAKPSVPSQTNSPSNNLWNSRIAPSFTVVAKKTASEPVAIHKPLTTQLPESTKVISEHNAVVPEIVNQVVDSTPEPTQVETKIAAVEPEVVETAPVQIPEKDIEPEPLESEPVLPTKETEQTAGPALAPVKTTALNSTDAVERINMIKREVNSMVGNPVNLIDVNNEVGREYMNALLDAMKKTSAGTDTQELARVMSRLEQAFVSVKETLATGDTSKMPEVKVIETPAEDPPASSLDEKKESESRPDVEPVLETVKRSEVLENETTLESKSLKVKSLSDNFQASEPEKPKIESDLRNSGFSDKGVQTQSLKPSSSIGISPVAKEKQIDALMADQKREQLEALKLKNAESAANPYMSEEVTRGLHQLLSEWKLFKSSGIFGTGPSGDEHQLYKKIAPLTMAAVLAGRFEGSTPEIKQTINEYMNGWRYEEGITHELGETFENYLRRVIRHILDKKKPV